MNQDNNPQQPQQEMNLPNCGDIIGKLPFGTRFVFFGLVIFWIMDCVSDFPKQYLGSSVFSFFNHYYIWTLFTANIYSARFFMVILIIYNYSSFIQPLEQRMSTGVFLFKYLINGAVIQLLTLSIQYLLIYTPSDEVPVNGASGIWFCLLFKYCYYNSKADIKFCCFNWKFKRSLYPFILFGVCVVISFGIPLDMLVGLLYGMIQVGLEKFTVFPGGLTTKIGGLINIGYFQCWIPHYETHDCSDEAAFTNLEQQESTAVPKSSPDSTTVNDPFSNQKGVRLGDY